MNRALGIAGVLVLMGCSLMAAPGTAAGEPDRGWYLNGGLGVAVLDRYGNMGPPAEIGFHGGGTCGFRFNRRWALEFDTGFILYNSPRPDPETPGESVTLVPLVVNGIFHFPNSTGFEPHVGIGLGVSVIHVGGIAGGDVTVVFKGGVRRAINQRTSIGIDYTYYMHYIASVYLAEPVGSDTVNLGIHRRF